MKSSMHIAKPIAQQKIITVDRLPLMKLLINTFNHSTTGSIYLCAFNKGFNLKFYMHSQIQQRLAQFQKMQPNRVRIRIVAQRIQNHTDVMFIHLK